jgi:hypothetical protein
MSEASQGQIGFTIVVVTRYDPVEISLQHLGLDIDPAEAFHPESAPGGRDYPFDLNRADDLIHDAGYEATSGWEWTGRAWGAVVQPKTEPPEGWGVIRPGDRKAHYYRNTMALCRRVGFYLGPLTPDTGAGPDDHEECRRLLDREQR